MRFVLRRCHLDGTGYRLDPSYRRRRALRPRDPPPGNADGDDQTRDQTPHDSERTTRWRRADLLAPRRARGGGDGVEILLRDWRPRSGLRQQLAHEILVSLTESVSFIHGPGLPVSAGPPGFHSSSGTPAAPA